MREVAMKFACLFAIWTFWGKGNAFNHHYQNTLDTLDNYIFKANKIMPGLNYRDCLKNMHDNTYEVKCMYKNESKTCPEGPPEPRIAWFLQCLSKIMISNDFQVPVYVTHDALNTARFDRISKQLNAAKFKHVHYLTNDDIVNTTDPESHFKRIYNRREGGQRMDVEHELCIDILNSSYRGGYENSATMCNKHGTDKLSDKDKNLLLINHLVVNRINNCTTLDCVSNATVDPLRYALFLEDDAFVSITALRQIAELLLTGPVNDDPPVHLYWMCDSMCAIPPYIQPPEHLRNTQFVNGYYQEGSRTVVGVMLSLPTIKKMATNGNWIPTYRSIDHWYNYLIFKENLTVQHTFPPIICHGSHGLEQTLAAGQKRRKRSELCCEDFYDITHMHPHLTSLKFTRRQNSSGDSKDHRREDGNVHF